jgi:hypothetical protein
MGRFDPKCSVPGCRFEAVQDQDMCIRHGGVLPSRTAGSPLEHMPLCGATTRCGGTCKQPRMKGATRCRVHGGSAPQVQRKAKEIVARALIERDVERYGQPRAISAIDALVEELHRTMGRIDWLDTQLRDRPHDSDLATAYNNERGHLRQLAGQMVSAKLDEQKSVLSERAVEQLELALTGIIRELGHDPSNTYVRQVVARHLRAVGTSPATDTEPIDAEVVIDHQLPEPVAF